LLASATFSRETASGWQEVQFATPVAITANTTYVASYYTPSGFYSVTRPYFTSQVSSPPLGAKVILRDSGPAHELLLREVALFPQPPYKSMVVFSTRHSAYQPHGGRRGPRRQPRPGAHVTTAPSWSPRCSSARSIRLTFSYGLQRLGPGAFIGA
jgi:hypothetical protein